MDTFRQVDRPSPGTLVTRLIPLSIRPAINTWRSVERPEAYPNALAQPCRGSHIDTRSQGTDGGLPVTNGGHTQRKLGDLSWDRLDDTVPGDWVEFGEVPVEPLYESTPMTYLQPQCLCCPKHHHTPLEWDRCVLKCTVSRCKTAYPLSWFFWERNAARLLDEGLPWWELTMKPHAWTPLHLGLITMPFPEPEGPVSIQVRGFGPHHYVPLDQRPKVY